MMKVLYSKQAQKVIDRLDKPTKLRIKEGIDGLKIEPPKGDIKSMKGVEYEGFFRLRVGQYRIIFCYRNDTGVRVLFIYKIGSRGDIYK